MGTFRGVLARLLIAAALILAIWAAIGIGNLVGHGILPWKVL